MLCSTDTDTRIGIGRIRIRGYVKFLQKLKTQRCIGVSDTDTRIRIGYVIRGHVEVSGLYRLLVLAFVLFTHINVSSSNRELETAPPATCKFLFTIETITDVLFM